jgi:prophage regulatory protein
MTNVILRLPAVKSRTGLSRSTIYLRVADGSFPRPVSLGARAVGWIESDIEGWISRKITESRASSPATANREVRCLGATAKLQTSDSLIGCNAITTREKR